MSDAALSDAAADTDEDGLDWARPHPLTMLVETIDAAKQLAVPIVFVVFQGGGGLFDRLELLVVLGPLLVAAARYWSTRYAIGPEAVHHRHGVFRRVQQVLPRANVQNVSARSQLVARLTNLTELQISDASAEGDINLRLLSRPEAERITALLRDDQMRAAHARGDGFAGAGDGPAMIRQADGTLAPAPPPEPIVVTSADDLIRASVGNGLAIGPLVATVLLGLLIAVTVINAGLESITGNIFLLAPVLLPLILLTIVPRMITPMVRLAGFRLWSDPDRIRSQAGLLTEQRTSARRERVQLVHVDRTAVMRALGVERVRFATADLEGFDGAPVTYLSPGGPLDEWPDLARVVLGPIEVDDERLYRVSPLTRRRTLVRFAVGAALVLLIALVLMVVGEPVLGALAVAASACLVLCGDWYGRRRHDRLGYAVGASQLMCRLGAVDETLKILLKDKVQTIAVDQSWFQRRLDLADLRVGTAGSGGLGTMRIPDLPLETAESLADHLARAAAATPLSQTI